MPHGRKRSFLPFLLILLIISGIGFGFFYVKSLHTYQPQSRLELQISALFGDEDSEVWLALDYLKGTYGKKNISKGLKLLEKLAHRGNFYAQHNLGYWYSTWDINTGERDIDKAITWYRLSAAQNYPGSLNNLGHLLMSQNKKEEGIKLIEKSALQQESYALQKLGYWYTFDPENKNKNVEKGKKYYLEAANLGHPNAMHDLGHYYEKQGDYPTAIEWYTKSFQAQKYDAANAIGNIYANGSEEYRDINKAIEWMTMSANKENVVAQNWLGQLYFNGKRIPKDLDEADLWFKKSANNGNELGQFFVAHNLIQKIRNNEIHGDERHQASYDAMQLLSKSADQSYEPSKKTINNLRDNCIKDTDKEVKLYACYLTALIGHAYAKSYVENHIKNMQSEAIKTD